MSSGVSSRDSFTSTTVPDTGDMRSLAALHALHCPEVFTGFHLVVNVGHIHVHDVAKSVLGIVCYADEAEIAFYFYILV